MAGVASSFGQLIFINVIPTPMEQVSIRSMLSEQSLTGIGQTVTKKKRLGTVQRRGLGTAESQPATVWIHYWKSRYDDNPPSRPVIHLCRAVEDACTTQLVGKPTKVSVSIAIVKHWSCCQAGHGAITLLGVGLEHAKCLAGVQKLQLSNDKDRIHLGTGRQELSDISATSSAGSWILDTWFRST